ncbi:MAG: tetratricopeptide repeat protein [Bacteroidetes bacterium]|nr:tetratricopeptide repeat protein [Bacteroidota bacterium]
MQRIFYSLIAIVFFCLTAFAENGDSLKAALSNAKTDSSRFNVLDKLAWAALYSDIDKAQYFANEGLLSAVKSKEKKIIARAHHTLATVFLQENKNDSALFHFRKAIKLFSEAGMEEKSAGSYNGMGNVCLYEGAYEKALDNYLQALRLLEKNPKYKDKTGLVLGNIGIVYYNLDNFDKAIEFYNRALEIHTITGDSAGMANTLSNLGNIYKDKNEFDKAENYFSKASLLFETLHELYGAATCYASIGLINASRENYVQALGNISRALDMYKDLKNEDGITNIYCDLGQIYFQMKKYQKAIEYLNQSIEMAKKIGAKNRIMEAYGWLHKVYESKKDFENGYRYLNLYLHAKDSILNQDNSKNIARMQTIYETEEKEQQLEAKETELKKEQAELRQKTIQRNAFLFGGGLILILMIVIYIAYAQKKKSNKAITFQKEIIEQKNKDITDSINYAKRIQTAILPGKEFVQKLFPQSFVFYHPRDIVSGDFYFFAEAGKKKIAAACDCTGHGVPGAFMSMIGNDLLHKIVNENKITDTAKILSELHKNILQALNQDIQNRTSFDGMDVSIICYDEEKKQIQFSGAIRPLYYFTSAGFQELKGDRNSVGAEGAAFSSQQISLNGSSTFYLFSDGYVDQFGGKNGKKFMAKKFKDVLNSVQKKSMQEQEEILSKELFEWKNDRGQVDDVLVIGIRI